MKKKFYITTAIAYPNSVPHLGHALEIIQADVIARFNRVLGKDVFFQTGTDEHGLKNWQSAQKEGKDILEFLDQNVNVFKKLYKKLNISYDNFIRTSDKKIHYPSATKLWQELVKSGDIYKKNYKGLYCTGCESFKTEKELENGKCPKHPTRDIETVEEENYFFKLSKYKKQLIKKIESDEYKIMPEIRKNEILSFLKDVKDISFSRPKTTLPWGIPVPGDDKQVMYVWCDALSNYITGVGYGIDNNKFKNIWPADLHIIGKDILRFHAAFWPAMLLSANVELPKKLFVHGFILSKGLKMGKSTGNVIEPFDQIEKYGVDQFRFYMIGAMPINGDGEYSEEIFRERINSELVGNLANFCYRTLSFTNKNFNSEIKEIDNSPIIKEINLKIEEVKNAYEQFDLKKAVDEILEISAIGNKYFQDNEPWKLINVDKEKSHRVLGLSLNIVKNLSILIQPILPEFSSKLQKQLNLSGLKWEDIDFKLKNHKIGQEEILITKIEKDKILSINIKPANKVEYGVDQDAKSLGVNACFAEVYGVNVKKRHEGLEKIKCQIAEKIENLSKIDNNNTRGYRNIYKKIGFEELPSSIENLADLIKKNGRLPTINTVVDSYNLISVDKSVVICAHDMNKINGKVRFTRIKGKEIWIPLNSKETGEIRKDEYGCVDDTQVLSRLDFKQSEMTKVDDKTHNVVITFQGNSNISDDYLRNAAEETCQLITRFCGGTYRIVEPEKMLEQSSAPPSVAKKEFPLNLKVAKIIEVKDHPNADKLYIMKIDLGNEVRQSVAGLKEYFSKDELLNKKIVVMTNLEKAKLRGELSEVMVLVGTKEDKMKLLDPGKAKIGEEVSAGSLNTGKSEVSFKDFTKLKKEIKNKKVYYDGNVWKTSSGDITVDIPDEGNVE